MALALLLSGVYLSYTGPTTRNPDPLAHLAYMRWVLEHHAPPTTGECAVCHHPPLYYFAGALALRSGEVLGLANPARAVQLLSWLLTAVYLGFGAALFGVLLRHNWQRTLATALLAFWPYTIIQSARINPDVAVNAAAAVVLYCTARWWRDRSTRWLAAACGGALLSLFVKATGLTLVAAVLGVMVWDIARSPRRGLAARKVGPWAALTTVATLLHGLARGDAGDGVTRGVLGTAYKTSAAVVDHRSAGFYLHFDLGSYFRTPYALASLNSSREPSFWNHWLKSSLFGTRNSWAPNASDHAAPNEVYAVGLAAMLLVLLLFVTLGVVLTWRRPSSERQFALVVIAPYLCAALAFHALVPTGHHADFRFVFPLLLPLCLLLAEAAGRLRARGNWLWHGSYLLASEWAALCTAYIVPGLRPPEPPAHAPASAPTATAADPVGAPVRPAASSPRPVRKLPRGIGQRRGPARR